jgi:DNA polymerase-3 subunit alpha
MGAITGSTDTCTEVTTSLLKVPGGRGDDLKLPTLADYIVFLLIEAFGEA